MQLLISSCAQLTGQIAQISIKAKFVFVYKSFYISFLTLLPVGK